MIKLVNILTEILLENPIDDLSTIIDLPVDDFVSKFKDMAGDPKVRAILNAGKRDGDPTDEIVHYNVIDIPVRQLIPTQAEIGISESLVSILTDNYKQLFGILGDKRNVPMIVSLNKKYIIDGHHRWSEVYIANPNASIQSLNFIDASLHPEDLLKAIHLGIAADTGELPLSPALGSNLFTATENEIKRLVYTTLTEPVIKIYKRYGIGSDRESIAAYIWNNVSLLQRKNKPIHDAPDRNFMPQTDAAVDLPKMLQHGIVNFINPKPDDAG